MGSVRGGTEGDCQGWDKGQCWEGEGQEPRGSSVDEISSSYGELFVCVVFTLCVWGLGRDAICTVPWLGSL